VILGQQFLLEDELEAIGEKRANEQDVSDDLQARISSRRTGRREDETGSSHNENSNQCQDAACDLVPLCFHFEEDDGEDESGDDGSASHHLVNRAGNKIESNVLESRSHEIAHGWNGK